MAVPVHADVERVVACYLQAVDDEAPGLVEGLYLTGSAALEEFRPRTSDVDFVAVTTQPLEAHEIAAVRRAHERLRSRCPRPTFDGRYLTWADLARDPKEALPGPYVTGGRFHLRGYGDCNPVTWHTLAWHGVRLRGPDRSALAIQTDSSALHDWTLNNYDSYWRPLLRRARRFPDPWSLIAFTSYGAVWIVLGVCRLHYTLASGKIGSKEAAGAYGLATFPTRWHRALNEALRIRRADCARAEALSALVELMHDLRIHKRAAAESLYRTPLARRRDTLAFADMVIADAASRHRT
jgi:hypothetical protein